MVGDPFFDSDADRSDLADVLGEPLVQLAVLGLLLRGQLAAHGFKGNTAQGGTKSVRLEGGLAMNVPLFIEEGDVIKINTETGEYTERVSKA